MSKETFDFSEALRRMKEGKKVRRIGWGKGKDIGAYVAGYVEEKYIILGFNDYTGCISCFTSKIKNLCGMYHSYRFAKLKYLEVVKH